MKENTRVNSFESVSHVWNPGFIKLLLINGLMYSATQVSNSMVPVYAKTLTDSAQLIGFAVSAMGISCLIMKIIAAPVMASFNKRIILFVSLIVMGTSFLGIGISKSISAILFFRTLQGIGLAFSSPCFLTLACETLPSERMTTGIGYFSLGQTVGMAVGPSIGLELTRLTGYQNTFFSAFAAMTLIGVWVFLFVKPVNDTGGGRIKFNLSINNIIAKEALLPTGLIFISSMVFFVISTFLILFAKERNIEKIGLFFTVYSITLLFSRPFTGRLADKIGAAKVLIPAIGCFASSFVLISFSTALWMFLLAAFIQGFGYGAVLPQLQALVIKSVTKERRSVASCTSYIGNDLGTFAGPILGGFVATRTGYAQMWLIMVIPLLLALGIVIIFRYKIDKIGSTVRPMGNDKMNTELKTAVTDR